MSGVKKRKLLYNLLWMWYCRHCSDLGVVQQGWMSWVTLFGMMSCLVLSCVCAGNQVHSGASAWKSGQIWERNQAFNRAADCPGRVFLGGGCVVWKFVIITHTLGGFIICTCMYLSCNLPLHHTIQFHLTPISCLFYHTCIHLCLHNIFIFQHHC